MASPSYPTSLDALANPGPTTETDDAGFELDLVVARLQNCVMAIEQKVGIGASTPAAAAAVLRRTASGVSAWGQLQASDVDPSGLLALAADNPIINGGFEVWQRGASFVGVGNSSAYYADRYSVAISDAALAARFTIARSSNVPAVAALVPHTGGSLQLTATTGDATSTGSDAVYVSQAVEGWVWEPFAGKQFTLGFWVMATQPGTYCVTFRNSTSDQSYIATYTVGVASTWEYKTITVPASPSGGSWNYTTGIGLSIFFTFAAGPTYYGTAGAWSSSGTLCTSSQTNAFAANGNTVQLWGLTMGLGATVAPYWPRLYAQELALCKRYYQEIGTSAAGDLIIGGYAAAGGTCHVLVPFTNGMRATPAVGFGGVTWALTNTAAMPNVTGAGASSAVLSVICTAAGIGYVYNSAASSRITLSAEL